MKQFNSKIYQKKSANFYRLLQKISFTSATNGDERMNAPSEICSEKPGLIEFAFKKDQSMTRSCYDSSNKENGAFFRLILT